MNRVKRRLDSWLSRPGSAESRDMAARRGTAAHWSAEKMLRLSQRLARSAANKRNSYKLGEDGLYRAPKAVTKWSFGKSSAISTKGCLERFRLCARLEGLAPRQLHRCPCSGVQRLPPWRLRR